MPNITTRNAYMAIREHKTFKAGALRGVVIESGTYVVYSYAVEIARWTAADGWTVNDKRYSATTSRHQTQVRLALSDDYNRSK